MRVLAAIATGLCMTYVPPGSAQDAQDAKERAMEVALSDHTLQLKYMTGGDMANVVDSQLIFGGFLSEERDVIGTAGLLVPIDWSTRAVTFALGPQVYAALLEEENNDVFAFALGAEVRLEISKRNELAVVGSAYYAPDVLTFGSADNLTDLSARAEARLTDQVIAFGGFRWFELDLLEEQERKLQDEVFAGIRWRFR